MPAIGAATRFDTRSSVRMPLFFKVFPPILSLIFPISHLPVLSVEAIAEPSGARYACNTWSVQIIRRLFIIQSVNIRRQAAQQRLRQWFPTSSARRHCPCTLRRRICVLCRGECQCTPRTVTSPDSSNVQGRVSAVRAVLPTTSTVCFFFFFFFIFHSEDRLGQHNGRASGSQRRPPTPCQLPSVHESARCASATSAPCLHLTCCANGIVFSGPSCDTCHPHGLRFRFCLRRFL